MAPTRHFDWGANHVGPERLSIPVGVYGDKVRLIDNYVSSEINSTVQSAESPKPHSIAAVILESMKMNLDIAEVGRTLDLSHAYRQVAIKDSAKWAAYIVVFNPQTERSEVYQLHALPFGSIHSVHTFLRLAHSLWWLGTVGLHPVWTHYFDDFVVLSGKESSLCGFRRVPGERDGKSGYLSWQALFLWAVPGEGRRGVVAVDCKATSRGSWDEFLCNGAL